MSFESVNNRFSFIVEQNPNKPAVCFNNTVISYAELDRRVHTIATLLSIYQPTEPQALPLVALLIDHNAEMVTAMLSTLVAGCAYQPLDTSFPDERLEKLLSTSQPFLVMTSSRHSERVSALVSDRVKVVIIDEIHIEDTPPIQTSTDANAAAYMLSTSGTTGEPKCILHTQQSLLRGVCHYLQDFAVTPKDRIALVLPCTYTPAIFCTFGALLSGASLHVFDLKNQTIEDMAEWLASEQITLLYSSPTIFRRLMHEYADKVYLQAIRSIQLAGEPLFKSDLEAYQASFADQFSLYNGMGTTETSCLTRFFINGETVIDGQSVPIGKPYDDVEISIVDESGQIVPQGQEGELVVKGDCIARGYFLRPELSKSFNIPDNIGEAITYHTGDRAKLNDQGEIIHLGRLDGQIKLRGQRVELTEIEATILRSGLATEAVVCLNQNDGHAYLSAFFQPEVEIGLIRQYLSTQLPPFMIPTRMVGMQTLPTNTSGKVDRLALSHYSFKPDATDGPDAHKPKDVIESRVINAFQQVLNKDPMAANSNFFDHGGDSLKAVELAIILQQALGIPINISVLIESPTPRLLAKKARELLHADGANHLIRFEDEDYQAGRAENAIPIFCIPGLYGDALSFRAFAPEMLSARRVYALEYPGFDGNAIQFNTLAQLVGICYESIQKAYPKGAIALVCYSIGGVVGFELSRRFIEAGREVRLLAMLDCYAPLGIQIRHIRDYGRYLVNKVKDKVLPSRHNHAQSLIDHRREEVNIALGKAVFHYRPKPLSLENMLLVVAKDQPPALGFYNNHVQWDSLVVNGYQRVEVDGDHLSVIMPEKAAQMTRLINERLQPFEDAQGTISSSQKVQPFLADTWMISESDHLSVLSVDKESVKQSQRSLLSIAEQMTSRLEHHINDQLEPRVINSQQRGRYYYRKVALQGRQSQRSVAIAAIRIAMDALPPSAVEEVVNIKEPFGKILSKNAIQYQCELASVFQAAPDKTMQHEFQLANSEQHLFGRCNQFKNMQGRVLADVVEVLAPWV